MPQPSSFTTECGSIMSLLNDIAELRGDLEAAKPRSAPDDRQASASGPQASPDYKPGAESDALSLLHSVDAIIADAVEGVEKNPRLTALATFGLGLLLGLAIGARE